MVRPARTLATETVRYMVRYHILIHTRHSLTQYWHSIGTDVTPGGEKRSPKEVCSPAESAAWRAQLILGRLLSFTPQERCKKSAVRPRVAHRLHGLLPSMDQTNRLSGARRYRTLRDHEPSDPEAGSFRESLEGSEFSGHP